MKKVILSLVMMLIMVSGSNGAVSEDMSVYVRKDVFEVYMQNINTNMERILQKLDKLDAKVDRNTQSISALSERVTELSTRVDGLETRMGDFGNYIYWVLVMLGIILTMPIIQKVFQGFEKPKENQSRTVTLEDVKRLIEENNVKMRNNPQA